MFRRSDIRYHTLWVRLVCCLAVGTGIANAVHFGTLVYLEELLRYLLVYSEQYRFRYAGEGVEVPLALVAAILPALPRMERPVVMVSCGTLLVFAYAFGHLAVLLASNYVLPIVSPLLGIIASTAVMETLAWSEERIRRTELEQLEETRQRFADMLVHDMRKRMSSLLLSFSLLRKNLAESGADAGDLASTVQASADRMLILINNLLEARKFEEGRMDVHFEVASLRELLHNSLEEHRVAAGLAGVVLRLSPGADIRARADANLVARVLANLLWNAIQHAPANTEVQIDCGLGDTGNVLICVGNRGEPIPDAEQGRLFLPFGTVHSEGQETYPDSTGLGLAFCKLAAEAHGGHMSVESPWRSHGDGVRVTFELPSELVLRERNRA